MNDVGQILEIEEKYKKLLMNKLSGDKRLSVICPEFRYPEPVYVYVKSVNADKTIAIRIDGGDRTVRFWDYVDDDYTDEDGVWANLTEAGIESFVKKLYKVMAKAVDLEYYGEDGECADYHCGVADCEFTAENAQKLIRKYGKNIDFVLAKFSNFYGDIQYVFDKSFRRVAGK